MAYGDVILAYSQAVEAAGFTENSQIDKEDYAPTSTAHKSYYLQLIGKSGETLSSNSEDTVLTMAVSVLLHYPRSVSYEASEAANSDLAWTIEKALFNLAASETNIYHMFDTGWETQRFGDFKLFVFTFSVKYLRSLEES